MLGTNVTDSKYSSHNQVFKNPKKIPSGSTANTHDPFPKISQKTHQKAPGRKKIFSLLEKLTTTRRESIGLMRQKILSVSQDFPFAEETKHAALAPISINKKYQTETTTQLQPQVLHDPESLKNRKKFLHF